MGGGSAAEWKKTACILCVTNCGIQVKTGGEDGRRIERVRGDKDHPASKGYTCNKALQLDYYQNARDRLSAPLRRRADGSFEEIDWDTAIAEIADRFVAIRDRHGGEKIFYYGGGGQGNHLGGLYASSLRRALGMKYRSNAIAQEKTGYAWVGQRMLGGIAHGDFERCEVAVFIGKNPWQSNGIQRARAVLRQISRDPARTLIVIDPRKTETAELADIHLAVRPGRDAWCVAALLGVLTQEDLVDHEWIAAHASGFEPVAEVLREIPVARYAEICGIAEERLRETARRIAAAESASVYEDLGVQMAPNSTLNTYLDNLLFLLTGNLGKEGSNNLPSRLVPLYSFPKEDLASDAAGYATHVKTSPVTGARIISDLVPCNVIADEILTDHPERFRAMLVESANPAHSLADSKRMREALSALELLVVIDVAMTETAALAHYVLPAASQYEKWEATFFNFEFPHNCFHLRAPILGALPGTLPEAEIHARLIEAVGAFDEAALAPLADAAREGRAAFAEAYFATAARDPELRRSAPYVLYRTLGPTLPDGAAAAAALWGAAHLCAAKFAAGVARAGFTGAGLEPGEKLFDAILASRSGTVFTIDEADESFRRIRLGDGKANLHVPEMLDRLENLSGEALDETMGDFPLVLAAGERRSYTANTVIRDPGWLKSNNATSLTISPADAERLGLRDGAPARLSTKRYAVDVVVEIDHRMQAGHISLPNGLGLSYPNEGGGATVTGVPPNELTALEDRDDFAGTPWHKFVPARLEPLGAR